MIIARSLRKKHSSFSPYTKFNYWRMECRLGFAHEPNKRIQRIHTLNEVFVNKKKIVKSIIVVRGRNHGDENTINYTPTPDTSYPKSHSSSLKSESCFLQCFDCRITFLVENRDAHTAKAQKQTDRHSWRRLHFCLR